MSKASRSERIIHAIRDAGVVGAGGAGFPTHVKLNARVDVVIANGAECEPLLVSDQAVMISVPGKVVSGLQAAMEATGAELGYVAIKKKHAGSVMAMRDAVSGHGAISIIELEDFYPAGDEHLLIHEVTGRYVPEGGLPLEAGVVVSNVTTLANIADALEGRPVTHRIVTVVGEVERPIAVSVPIGTAVEELVCLAGGLVNEDSKVLLGGPMMGDLVSLEDAVITKLTGGVIVLPKDHVLIRQRTDSLESVLKRARSSCCQCMLCTETCPRSLMGHNLSPHLIMRTLSMSLGNIAPDTVRSAWLCSQCRVCETIACPSGLSPARVNQALKASMAEKGIKNPYRRKQIEADPMRVHRRVPSSRVYIRAGITEYLWQPLGIMQAFNVHRGKTTIPVFAPKSISVPLLQHRGVPAVPCVKQGDRVAEGDLIADIPDSAFGARVHAGISGVVKSIDERITIVTRRR